MNPIVLHLGLTKTGSTSLQTSLSNNTGLLSSLGLIYPRAGRTGTSKIAHHNLFYETSDRQQGNGTFDPKAGGWARALAEIDEVRGYTGILSSEAFQFATQQQVKLIRGILGDRSIMVVIYVRRPDLWLESAWNQRARFGRVNLRFVDFYQNIGRYLVDYASVVLPWIEMFGDHQVDVRIFGPEVHNLGVVGDFASAYLGPEALPLLEGKDERSNRKAGLKHLVAVARVSQSCQAELGNTFVISRRSAIRISSYFRGRTDSRKYQVVNFDQAVTILNHHQRSIEKLAAASTSFRHAKPFTQPLRDDFQNFVDPELIGDDIFDGEEREFIARMSREIVKVTKSSSLENTE